MFTVITNKNKKDVSYKELTFTDFSNKKWEEYTQPRTDVRIVSNATDDLYRKWRAYYEPHVKKIYRHLMSQLQINNILYRDYDFDEFCKYIYNNSSKRVPIY
jgi:hypothetical protein